MKKVLSFLLFISIHISVFSQIITDTKEISICDADGDGYVSIPFSQLQEYALDILMQFNESPEIYVTKAHRGIEKITNLYDNPQIVPVCGDTDGAGGYYDIAINNQNEIYVTRKYGVLQKVNLQNCTYQTIGQIHPNGQTVLALSFDHLNNLYEGGWTSKVYRADAGNLTQFYLWHDFGIGNSSGDFVQIDDFLYVAWTMPDGKDHLFKVTLGPGNQYVSHQDLGKIKTGTFGLAAEYGRLYGNTVDELYEINLQTMDLPTIKERPNQQQTVNHWWGAAGLHEAMNIQISYHSSQQDATSGSSPLNDPYTNPVPFQESFVYIRVHESTQNTTYIIPVRILISVAPVADNVELNQCKDPISGLATFQLNDAQNEINPNSNLNFSYFDSLQDLENNQNPLPPTISIANSKTVYVKVSENNPNCYGISELNLNIPSMDVPYQNQVAFCSGTETVLSIPDEFTTYQWEGLQGEDLNQNLNTNEVIVTHAGTYSLIVTDENGCTFTLPFEVVIGGEPVINEVKINTDNSITIYVSPSGMYEYSLDGIFWQSSPTFYNLPVNDYDIHVRDLVGCYSDVYKFAYFLIPNFFSPNGDGTNDAWVVRGLDQYPDAHIKIFDRYGKKFYDRKANSNGFVWDGMYLGRPVSSGTYWYIIQLSEDNKISGHINVRNK